MPVGLWRVVGGRLLAPLRAPWGEWGGSCIPHGGAPSDGRRRAVGPTRGSCCGWTIMRHVGNWHERAPGAMRAVLSGRALPRLWRRAGPGQTLARSPVPRRPRGTAYEECPKRECGNGCCAWVAGGGASQLGGRRRIADGSGALGRPAGRAPRTAVVASLAYTNGGVVDVRDPLLARATYTAVLVDESGGGLATVAGGVCGGQSSLHVKLMAALWAAVCWPDWRRLCAHTVRWLGSTSKEAMATCWRVGCLVAGAIGAAGEEEAADRGCRGARPRAGPPPRCFAPERVLLFGSVGVADLRAGRRVKKKCTDAHRTIGLGSSWSRALRIVLRPWQGVAPVSHEDLGTSSQALLALLFGRVVGSGRQSSFRWLPLSEKRRCANVSARVIGRPALS